MEAALAKYNGARVFVTGHTGFKGSWLTYLLTLLGADVMGYALPPQGGGSHFEALGLGNRIRHREGDIRDAYGLKAAMDEFSPEFVFHLAAQAIVRTSYADPSQTFDVNVMGSVNVLEAVRQSESVRSLVYITSDKAYENREWIWAYRENDRLGGHDPYSASKAAAELVFSAYWNSFLQFRPDLGAASARAGNVIGGGDWARDRIVPDCIRSIRDGVPIVLRNPSATRPWQHVLEPLSGYLQLGASLRDDPAGYSSAWNFGPSSAEVRTVLEVAERLVGLFGKGSIIVQPTDHKQHEAQLLQLNCDKSHQKLGWRPRWNASQTLEATGDWYRAVLSGEPTSAVTERQLRQYFGELR